MIRFIIKELYGVAVSFIQLLFKKQRVQNHHVVVMMTFKEDVLPVIEALSERGFQVTVFTKEAYFKSLENMSNVTYQSIAQHNVYRQLRALTSAKVIVIDTYYHLFGTFKKRAGQTVIQTWHAAGALKNFGLEDHAVNLHDHKSVKQHQAVYNNTDKYLVGSPLMGECYKQSFGAQTYQFLNVGLPRLTHYLKCDVSEQQKQLKQRFDIKGKVAVYMPTYREAGQVNRIIDKQAFERELPDYTLLSKYHPAVKAPHTEQDISLTTPELLMIADVVITDYSSLAIEASFIDKPAIFYVYDEKDYERVRGLNRFYYDIPEDYKVTTEAALYKRMAQGQLQPLFKDWHTFNTPNSLNQLMNYVEKLDRS
ncbi:teichoic acid biosynthesis protein B [Staphylococcus microti]|uniref:Teichoic acid biosynthesis protein B n=1 Tax=Staphylococcus microti TaxID=569857 RepID=A0A0D6XPF6_9STAP|nr:teichoic acid glycerol-phosphate primase TarB [Staphylococcus microti]KIX90694.1 teichoic acid biosynthesis protein B [Staphylococcus microti]PNZ81745.1 CDP-glycerol glycerophosphotransferase family protein [Staphylococcus microti]SUM56727.1 teichoic acid biosynthesis protein B [Staphylococcus microti]